MNPLNRTPAKLKIFSYSTRDRKNEQKNIEVMYNPDSILLKSNTVYAPDDFINTNQQSSRYVQTQPEEMSLELLFDAQMPGNHESLTKKIGKLQEMLYAVEPATGEPCYLRLEWGNMAWMKRRSFDCRLSQFQVRYTLFSKNGKPLRATVTLGLIEDQSLLLQEEIANQKAPKNTVVSMPDSTSLPALVNDVSESSINKKDYLTVAMDNDMDSIDGTEAGDLIAFTESEDSGDILTDAQAREVEKWLYPRYP